jgi:hypothetical protein
LDLTRYRKGIGSTCNATSSGYLPSLARTPLYGSLNSPIWAMPVNAFPETTPLLVSVD